MDWVTDCSHVKSFHMLLIILWQHNHFIWNAMRYKKMWLKKYRVAATNLLLMFQSISLRHCYLTGKLSQVMKVALKWKEQEYKIFMRMVESFPFFLSLPISYLSITPSPNPHSSPLSLFLLHWFSITHPISLCIALQAECVVLKRNLFYYSCCQKRWPAELFYPWIRIEVGQVSSNNKETWWPHIQFRSS